MLLKNVCMYCLIFQKSFIEQSQCIIYFENQKEIYPFYIPIAGFMNYVNYINLLVQSYLCCVKIGGINILHINSGVFLIKWTTFFICYYIWAKFILWVIQAVYLFEFEKTGFDCIFDLKRLVWYQYYIKLMWIFTLM